MLMLTSSEFVALCRAQVVLLSQTLGASLTVVYLTQELADGAETQLIPIMAYPETAVDWRVQGEPRSLMAAIDMAKPSPRLLTDANLTQASQSPKFVSGTAASSKASPDWFRADTERTSRFDPEYDVHSGNTALVPERRIVLPLMHEDVVLGLLVTERHDRLWTEWEQTQIHQIADTLAIACVLDQRYQWLEQDHRQQQQLQEQQHDVLDNMLHQFRNSLTALQTFGKLILKRLLPGDANREIAASLVRETVRLRDLAQQLEAAVAGTDASSLPPLALPPASGVLSAPHSAVPVEPEAVAPPLLPAAGFLSGTLLVLEPCAIATVLEPLIASARAIAQDRGLTFFTTIPDTLPLIQANVSVLQEVLSNVIDNALKYTPAGGQVLVEASLVETSLEKTDGQAAVACKQRAEIAITDTGPGIPPGDLPHIFERRYRGVQAQTDTPGSGLGLAIAYALVTQMKGEIAVFSPARLSHVKQNAADTMVADKSGTTVVVQLAIAAMP